MDYEKKYKEALSRAKAMIKVAANQDEAIGFANTIFPELKESEDERIRKGIIRNLEYLADRAEGFVKDELKERIAWLEKQGNTIPDECVFRPVAGCDIELAAKQAIKQQGVLAKEVVLAFNGAYIPVKGKTQDIIINEYNSLLEKQGQKPAWTEADENGLGDALWCCKQAASIAKDENDMGDAWYAEQWLKSLKNRIKEE